jgi:hypothetical protein
MYQNKRLYMKHLNSRDSRILLTWLPLGFVATLLIGCFYIALQHHIRQDADYPQVQLAEDIAASMYKNEKPSANLSTNVDVQHSLAPFVVLYDSNGRPVDGTGKLGRALPELPADVLEYTRKHVKHRLTWHPNDKTRIAAVLQYYQNPQHAGYVLAGRNLRETEKQQNSLLVTAGIAWAVTLLGSLALVILQHRQRQ